MERLRTFCVFCATVGLLAASLISPVHAEQRAAQRGDRSESVPEAPVVGDEVVVRGRRMSEIEDGLRIEIGKFIDEISVTPMGAGLARWDGSVCVGVHNLERTAAQYLVDRVSRLALEVGLRPGEPGCFPKPSSFSRPTASTSRTTSSTSESGSYGRPTWAACIAESQGWCNSRQRIKRCAGGTSACRFLLTRVGRPSLAT